jgi:4-aminobutyrate aminotransferase-like enzyme/Ser/Thr protein kinase RdoA (MazF antagonist)
MMRAIKQQAPTFTADDAVRIAAELYGLSVAGVEPLPGEHDQNFHLTSEAGEEFMLKLSHAGEERAILDLQHAALAHLANAAPSLALPTVRATITGESIASVPDPSGTAGGAEHFVWMLTYVPGRLLARTSPHSPALLRSLGECLGTLDRALIDFSHPAARRRELKWDLAGSAWIRPYLGAIEDSGRRALVARLLDRFEADALPALAQLRTSVIHNDANDYNILVGGSGSEERQVVGLVDFGDMLESATICEPAIACAYAMMGKADPLAAAAQVVAGYHAALPLIEPELAVLYPLICARLCVSVTNSAYQRAVDPGNEYLQISDAPAWALLDRLADVPPRFAHYLFRDACGLPACPATPPVVLWLRGHADEIGPVVEPELRPDTTLTLDLSIGSLDLGNVPDFADTAAFSANVSAQMRAAGAHVAVGRYDEARPIYIGDAYRVEGNDGPEWRTVHTALDLFLEPGAPVFAPLDGVVHSFANNAAPRDYGPTILLRHDVLTAEGEPLSFYTLYGHLSLDSLDGLSDGMAVARGARIGRIGDASVNGGWPPHLHFQLITDLLGRRGEFPGVARPSQRSVWLSLSPDPRLMARVPDVPPPHASKARGVEQLLAVRRRHLGPNLSVSYRRPLKIVRGYRQHLYDAEGRAYLDAVNNVAHVGHSHPHVVRAGARQMAVLNTNTRYLHDDLARFAERLCATLPEPLRVCYFVCSGSEANELALRLARARAGRKDIVVLDAAYHGNTSALVEASPYKFDGPGGEGGPPHVHVAALPDVYRGPHRADDPRSGAKYGQLVGEALSRAEAQGTPVAAFLCESIPGCGGQIVLPPGYLETAYAASRVAGALCIADEVQTGFGRVGTHFWAFETQGVIPDIVTMGKPIGNGHPLGAVVTTPEIAASFDNGMEYFNTFGGNPVSCAIGLAVLDVVEREGLQAHALTVGAHLLDGLRALANRHVIIGDVRGQGLFVGVELVRDRETLAPAPEQATYVTNRLRERGVLLSTDGPLHNVLKIKPPLVFDRADADFLVDTLDTVLDEDFAQPRP